jgi:RimJ/RimL family protein N-acetyltransferase
MIELTPDQICNIQPLFERLVGSIPLQGILENRHPARVFADDLRDPTCAFTWTPWGYFYLAGTADRHTFLPALKTILDEELLPASKALGQSGFILWPDSPAWAAMLPDLLPNRSLIKIFRRTFTFDPATFYEGRYSRPSTPPGFSLKAVDAALVENNHSLAAEILTAWRSLDDYFENGVGICLMEGVTLVSVCFSMFISRGKAEVNVFTAEKYRSRGFATLAAAGFIDACLKRGLQPNWECFWDNIPSLRLAEYLGFKAQVDTPVYYWEESVEYVNI